MEKNENEDYIMDTAEDNGQFNQFDSKEYSAVPPINSNKYKLISRPMTAQTRILSANHSAKNLFKNTES
jgi:hypothetical protein